MALRFSYPNELIMDMKVPEVKREYLKALMSVLIVRVTKKSHKQKLLNSLLLFLIQYE